MKKNILFFAIAVLSCHMSMATEQFMNDTTFRYGKKIIQVNDSADQVRIKVLNKDSSAYRAVYEGIFTDRRSFEKWSVQQSSGLSFGSIVETIKKTFHGKKMEAHWAGISWGFLNVADQKLNIGNTDGMDLKAESSNEFSLNLIEKIIPIYRDKLGITTGFGMRWSNYFLDNNLIFKEISGITNIQPAEIGYVYTKSRLRTYKLTIPLFIEWQPSDKLFLTAGVIGGVNTFSSYKVRYRLPTGGYYEGVAEKGLNVNPLSVDFCAQIGYGELNLVAKYAAIDLFQKNKGPKVRPVSLGLMLNF